MEAKATNKLFISIRRKYDPLINYFLLGIFFILLFITFREVSNIYTAYVHAQTPIGLLLLISAIILLGGFIIYKFKKAVNKDIQQSFETGKIQEATEQSEVLIAMSNSLKASNERLRMAHAELENLFENIGEAFFSLKIDFIEEQPCFTTLQMSPACINIYGYEPDDFFRNPTLWRSLILRQDQQIIDKSFSRLLVGRAVTLEYRICNKDGNTRWIQTKMKPTRSEEKMLVRLDGITTDITARKLAEESLQKSEGNLRAILDNTAIGYLLIDKSLGIISFNQQAQKFIKKDLHCDLREGDKIVDYLQEDRKARMTTMIQEAFEGKNNGYETSYSQHDGSLRYYNIQLFGVANGYGEMFAVTISVHDITEHKNVEAELKRNFEKIAVNQRLMKGAEKLAHFGSWQTNFIDGTVEWSDEAFRLYGYEQGEIPPTYELFLKHVHPEDLKRTMFTLENAVKLHDMQKLNFRIIDKYGAIKYIQAALMMEKDASGRVIHVLGFKQDVTEKVMLEKRIQEEKHQRQQQITEAVITAQEKERLFLGEELHDNINPILATVKLYMDCAINDPEKRLDLIRDSKEFVNTAMSEIRTLSKSLVPPSLKEVGLISTIEDLVESIRKVNAVEFISDWDTIYEDEISEKLQLTIFRIVQEQLNNIFKYAQATTVMIRLRQNDGKLKLIIRDDGVGFDTTQKRQGVGLQNIASRADIFGGELIINSSPGHGCELIVDFNNHPNLS